MAQAPKTLTLRGVTYKVRYFTQDGSGPVRAVLDIDWKKVLQETGGSKGPLQGPEGDEWPMKMVGGKCVGPEADMVALALLSISS